MTKPKTLDQLRAEKERAETQLAQEQHKLERLENRKKYLEKGERTKRTHRLCNLGGTIESLAPEVKDLTRTEMHDIDTFMFFKWAFKSAAAAIIVNHTFDFIMAVFQVAQTMVQRSAGVIDTNASIDISSAIANITTELQATGLGDLFALMLETWVVSFAMKAMGLIITVILYGRMIEIYIYASVGPLPFATFMNREWGNIGTNYVRGLAALGLQGFLIMICVGIYAVLVNALSLGGDLQASIWSCAAYTVLLCFSLFKTGSVAKSILNAH